MFDVDFSELDLGSRRKPVEWVVVAPTQPSGSSRQAQKYALFSPNTWLLKELSQGMPMGMQVDSIMLA